MKVKTVLIKMKALIKNPKNWIQCTYAEDKFGRSCFISSPTACKFCLDGALTKVTANKDGEFDNDESTKLYDRASYLLCKVCNDFNICDFNDTEGRTHKEIIDVLNMAIKECKE